MAGRRPKPTALKILQGNPGKRPLNEQEPKPEMGIPEMPWGMSRGAKREYKWLAPVLAKSGILAKIDGAALAAFCEAHATWEQAVRAQNKLGADGLFYMKPIFNKEGFEVGQIPVEHPLVNIICKQVKKINTFITHFGLSPATRTKLKVDKAHEEDPLDAALKATSPTVVVTDDVDLNDINEDSVLQVAGEA